MFYRRPCAERGRAARLARPEAGRCRGGTAQRFQILATAAQSLRIGDMSCSKKRLSSWTLGVIMPLALGACGSDDSGCHRDLLEECSGSYRCVFPEGDSGTISLSREGPLCLIGDELVLAEGGDVYVLDEPSPTATWDGGAERFSFCEDGECAQCSALPAR